MVHDCVVIGGGPAGLTAAIYLARFHLSVMVLEDQRSRAALIPVSHNHAGFPAGIPGTELLNRMRRQAESYGAVLRQAKAEGLARAGTRLRIATDTGEFHAETVLLATGVVNLRPDMTDTQHDEALARGLLRYCPVCDGYEVTDRRIALLGSGEHALKEAEFMRSYSPDVTLVAPFGRHDFTTEQRALIARWNIHCIDGPLRGIELLTRGIALRLDGGTRHFDTLYAALGTKPRSELACAIGAETGPDGAILVDCHQMTSVTGLYAAGDVVKGLDQISNAMGHAAVAATAMRNAICSVRPLRR